MTGIYELSQGLQHAIQETGETLTKLQHTLGCIQEICSHPKWEDTGHDSHYNYHKCTSCGFEETY